MQGVAGGGPECSQGVRASALACSAGPLCAAATGGAVWLGEAGTHPRPSSGPQVTIVLLAMRAHPDSWSHFPTKSISQHGCHPGLWLLCRGAGVPTAPELPSARNCLGSEWFSSLMELMGPLKGLKTLKLGILKIKEMLYFIYLSLTS